MSRLFLTGKISPVARVLQLDGTARILEPVDLGSFHDDTHIVAISTVERRDRPDHSFHDDAAVVKHDGLQRGERKVGECLWVD